MGRPMPGNSGTGVQAPSGGGVGLGRPCAAREDAATHTPRMSDRMGTEAIARARARQLDAVSAGDANYAMTLPSALEARVAELERERKHLLAIIEILKEVSTSLHFIDILQGIARKLGEAFGLDRCSIFLAERGGRSVRLVASYEDPTIRNYVVDLERYPELKRAMQGGETVFIPDAATDPSLKHVKGELISRRVKSITVVPITWRGVAIGAIFLRTFRDGPTFSDEDVRFVQVVASITAQALRNAHRYERLAQRQQETGETMRRMELERVALLSFLRRLLAGFGEREGAWAEGLLPRASADELDRLVGVAMAVIQEEAKGR
jgi:GAF domain-containing protein